MKNNSNGQEIAQTILAQLGGNRFIAMTGAKNLAHGENSLHGKLGKNAKGVTHFTVTLDATDTYTVRFCRVWGTKLTEKGTTSGVYFDMLRDLFESATEMRLSL